MDNCDVERSRKRKSERVMKKESNPISLFSPFLLDVLLDIGLQSSSETYERNCETALE